MSGDDEEDQFTNPANVVIGCLAILACVLCGALLFADPFANTTSTTTMAMPSLKADLDRLEQKLIDAEQRVVEQAHQCRAEAIVWSKYERCLHFQVVDGVLRIPDWKWRLGNRLGLYYGGRALAQAGAVDFHAPDLSALPLMAHLPVSSSSSSSSLSSSKLCPDEAFIERACVLVDEMLYPHLQPWLFDPIVDTIGAELRHAIDAHLAAAPPDPHAPWASGAAYAVVQLRCVIVGPSGPGYGPNAFSIVHRIPDSIADIYVVHPPADEMVVGEDPLGVCPQVVGHLVAYIKRHRPAARVQAAVYSVETSFIAMARASVLVREAASSFSLFAALANPTGTIVSSVDHHRPSAEPKFAFRPFWQMSAAAPLTDHSAPRQQWTAEAILHWLETH